MLNSVRSSVKNSVVYGIGNIAVKLVGFLLIPLYTDPKFFSIDEFGIIGLLDISGQVLIAALASSLPQSLTRWYWDKEYVENQKSIFFMTLLMQVGIAALFCLLLLPLSGQLSGMLFGRTDWHKAINLVIISSALQAVNNIINTLIRLQSKSVLFTVVNFFKLGVVLVMTVFMIVGKKMGVEGIYLAQVIGNLLFIVVLLGYTVKNCKVSVNFQLIKTMALFGFPLVLANVSGVAVNVIDRYSLNSLKTIDALKYVAIYTLAVKVSSVLKLVIVDSIKMAISPLMIRKIDAEDNQRFYSKVLLYSSFVLMMGIIAVSLFSLELIKVMTKSNQYWEAYFVIPLLCLSVYFVNLKDVITWGLFISKKTKIIGTIVLFAGIMTLGLNLLLVPLLGMTGAALSTLFAQVLYWYLIHYFSQKEYYIPYEYRKIFIMMLVGAALSCAGLLMNDLHIILRLVLKTGLTLSFPFILYFFNFYEPVELGSIKAIAKKWSALKKFRENVRSLKSIQDEL
ncbi:MAG: lipopolysaccharide biosynthesis protein [Chloroflexota bacterium]